MGGTDMVEKGPTPEIESISEAQSSTEMERQQKETHGKEDSQGPIPASASPQPAFNRDWRFWMIMVNLTFAVLLAALENTVVITSLPTIVQDIELGSNYIWVTNVYFLSSSCVQPLFGQLCNLFGRKNVLLFVFSAYVLGSGIAGGANSGAMLIAGRAIQGIGSGGLNMAADVVISDLVPLRYRGNYIAMLLLVGTAGFAIGPFVGGIIVENTTWRWVFYLNVPIGGVGIIITYLFLNLRWNRTESVSAKLRRIDYGGNALIIASTVSILIALTWGGPIYPWSDYRVLVPLIFGLAGLVGFMFYEASGIPAEPVIPIRLFPNRTSRIIYVNTFLNSILIQWCFFFFPLYFQAVKLSSPAWSGVQMLPVTLITIPAAALSAMALSKWGKFKILHLLGFATVSAGIAIIAVLERDSSTAAWVLIQILPAVGTGFLVNTMLPAFQASVAESDQAAATATWSFIRSFGLIWGVAVAGTVFNSYIKTYSYMIEDAAVREHLRSGDAYGSATREYVMHFAEPVRTQIQLVFLGALKKVFIIAVAFGGTAFVIALFEKNIPLREEIDTEYGLEEREQTTSKD